MSVSAFLTILDGERRLSGEASNGSALVREFSSDGSECRVVFADLTSSNINRLIRHEQSRADTGGYALEMIE